MNARSVLLLMGCGMATMTAACSDSEASTTAAGKADDKPAPEYLNQDPATTAPFSDAVKVGSTLYLAGNLGLDKAGNLVEGGISAEAEQTMQNLEQVLERNGSSLDRVAECEVMLADIKERDAFNEVYSKYWSPGHFPARHAFGVTGLYLGARVEMACVAVAG